MTIRVLDPSTVNKIAAGEVIERPASALKELLENSADSGATKIEIDFDGGGKKELKVTDDGHGMSPDELPLALHPHATSKIQSIEDLSSLKTFGFRGEALASLAAVSELSVHSSVKGRDDGAKIISQGGVHSDPGPAPAIGGTQVIARNLFFNVPARQKFLKSDAGETAAIKKIVKAFSLSHPELIITLRQNGRVIFHCPQESFEKRACRLLEIQPDQGVFINAENSGLSMKAVLGLPEVNLPTQQGIWIFVQGRFITDRTLQQAIFEGYRNLIMHHQYPRAVLSLHVEPSNVDVNVHPSKAQVKFANSGAVFRFVCHEIKQGLEKHFTEQMRPEAAATPSAADTATAGTETAPQETSGAPFEQVNLIRDAVTRYNQKSFEKPQDNSRPRWAQSSQPVTSPKIQSESPSFSADLGFWSSLQVVGQFANTYIVTQSPKALVLVDQHAAHERVLFERLKKQWSQGEAPKQPALLEELITLNRENIEALTEGRFAEAFAKMGFELVDRGPETLAVASRPVFLLDVPLKPLLERLSEQILEVGASGVLDDVMTDLWASMACHGAIRAGRVLATEEITALLKQMDEFAFSSFCPHGRPVSVQWSLSELEKLFKRIV